MLMHNHHRLLQCFVSTIRGGLLSGVGEATAPDEYKTFNTAGARVVFDVSFFIVVSTICTLVLSF